VSSELISIAPAVGVGITVRDIRSGVGVGVSVRVNNGGFSFWFGRPLVEDVGVAVGIRANVAMAYRVGAVVIVQIGRLCIGFRFGISGPFVKTEAMVEAVAVRVAVALVIARVAITTSIDGEAGVGVRLSLLDRRSASKGRQKHYRLF